MPRETFFNPYVGEDDPFRVAEADVFYVEWAPDGNYVVPQRPWHTKPLIHSEDAVCMIAGVYLDESGVDRLMAVLRRIKRKINNPAQSIRVGNKVYDCMACMDDEAEPHTTHRVHTPVGDITWTSEAKR